MPVQLGQRRVKVEGFEFSSINCVIAIVQLRTGQVHMVIEGVEPTIQNLVDIRQLLDQMVKEIDAKLRQMVQASVTEMNA